MLRFEMRTVALSIGLALITAVPAFAADPVQGDWVSPNGGARIRIGPCAAKPQEMCGVVVAIRDPAAARARDVNNVDPALKGRPMLGMPVLYGFKRDKPGRWTGGKVYAAKKGTTFDGVLTHRPDGTLKVEACVLPMVCSVQTWTRN